MCPSWRVHHRRVDRQRSVCPAVPKPSASAQHDVAPQGSAGVYELAYGALQEVAASGAARCAADALRQERGVVNQGDDVMVGPDVQCVGIQGADADAKAPVTQDGARARECNRRHASLRTRDNGQRARESVPYTKRTKQSSECLSTYGQAAASFQLSGEPYMRLSLNCQSCDAIGGTLTRKTLWASAESPLLHSEIAARANDPNSCCCCWTRACASTTTALFCCPQKPRTSTHK